MWRAEPPGSVSGGYRLDYAPVPPQAGKALGLTTQPSPPPLVPPSPAAAPRAPLLPPALLTPPQGAAVPLQPGDGTTVAVRYSQRAAPCLPWEVQERGEPSREPALVPAPGSVEQALAPLPGPTAAWMGSPL